jgi:hypothetical protein
MRSSTFLRIASVITLLNVAGHTTGYPWTPDVGPGAVSVLEAMKGYNFDVVGSARTYWDFYVGFGVIISVYLLMQTVLLWQFASVAKNGALRLRPIMATFFVACAVNTFLAWKYFFVIPLAISAANAVCLALAFAAAGREKTVLKSAV